MRRLAVCLCLSTLLLLAAWALVVGGRSPWPLGVLGPVAPAGGEGGEAPGSANEPEPSLTDQTRREPSQGQGGESSAGDSQGTREDAPGHGGGSSKDEPVPDGGVVLQDDLSLLVREVCAQTEPLTFSQPGDVVSVATGLLGAYQARGDCVLAQSGYLDLLGRVWGCVVQGGAWVDVCVVAEADEGQRCQVRVLRLDSEEVGELFDNQKETDN